MLLQQLSGRYVEFKELGSGKIQSFNIDLNNIVNPWLKTHSLDMKRIYKCIFVGKDRDKDSPYPALGV